VVSWRKRAAKTFREVGVHRVKTPSRAVNMNLVTLTQKDSTNPLEYFACGQCRQFWGNDKERAIQCCDIVHCEGCGAVVEQKHWKICYACKSKQSHEEDARREETAFAKAKKVQPGEAQEDMVYWEDGNGDCNGEGYFSSLQAVLDECDDDGKEVPAYVWACSSRGLHIDAQSVIESMLDEWYDGASDEISQEDHDKLQKLLDGWCDEMGMKCYDLDYSTAILLSEDWIKDNKLEP
jgi:hypothetical protein